MASIEDVTDYVITRAKLEEAPVSLTHLKLQKILYYIQAWSLGINEKALFNESFQAWVHGPVCREVYDRFSTKTMYSEIELSDRVKEGGFDLSSDQTNFIEYILENYLRFSGAELEDMTHKEQPWIEARSGLSQFARSENSISVDSMKEYYGRLWKEINEREA